MQTKSTKDDCFRSPRRSECQEHDTDRARVLTVRPANLGFKNNESELQSCRAAALAKNKGGEEWSKQRRKIKGQKRSKERQDLMNHLEIWLEMRYRRGQETGSGSGSEKRLWEIFTPV